MTSGAEIAPYLKAFKTDLFLSANSEDVQAAINSGVAAGRILTGVAHADSKRKINQIKIAFDGDAVLFSAEAEKIYQKAGMAAFGAHIFFDDQDIHTEPASMVVPSATVPYRDGDNPKD